MPVILLILSVVWASWTVLVDFFLVPAVFQTIPQFFLAGEMGIQVFSRLNKLEFPLACVLFGLLVWKLKEFPRLRWLVPLNLLLVGIAGIYLFSLTPKIAELTGAWEYADKMGTLGAKGYEDIQQQHQTYHQIYVVTDTVKLLLLLVQASWLGVFVSKRPQ